MTTSANVQHFFDAEASSYGSKHYEAGAGTFIGLRQERIIELVDSLALPRGARTLDAGCGPGLLSVALVRRGLDVHSLDFSAEMLARAEGNQRAQVPWRQPRLARGNVELLPYADQSFDLVCSAGVIEYLTGDERVLSEFTRVLRPGGYVIVSTTKAGAPVHVLEPLIEAIKRRRTLMNRVDRWRARRGLPPVRARHFKVRNHRPADFREKLRAADLQLVAERYFFFTPWPHPADRVLPAVPPDAERRLAATRSRLARWAAAGYIALARRGAVHSAGVAPQ